jgi:hypothetical protein
VVWAWNLVCNCNGRTYVEDDLELGTEENVGSEKGEETEGRRKVLDPELCI